VVTKLEDSMKADMKLLTDVQQKHAQKLATDGQAMNNFIKLVQEYANIVKV
jgi:hypothetical protein